MKTSLCGSRAAPGTGVGWIGGCGLCVRSNEQRGRRGEIRGRVMGVRRQRRLQPWRTSHAPFPTPLLLLLLHLRQAVQESVCLHMVINNLAPADMD